MLLSYRISVRLPLLQCSVTVAENEGSMMQPKKVQTFGCFNSLSGSRGRERVSGKGSGRLRTG